MVEPDYPPALYNMAFALRDRAASLPAPEADKTRARAMEYCRKYLAAMKAREHAATPADKQRVALANGLLSSLQGSQIARPPAKPPSPQLEKARRAIAQQAYEAALILLKDAIKQDPMDADALWELAIVYDKHLKYTDRAADVYKQFRKKFPNDPRAGGSSTRDAAPNPPPTTSPSASAAIKLFADGLAAHKKSDWDTAIDYYKRALKVNPNYVNAAYNLGLIYYASRKDLVKARDAFTLAVARRPEMASAQYMLGVVHRDMDDAETAIARLNKALRIEPNHAKAHFVLGSIYCSEGQLDVAKLHLRRYIQYAPQGQHRQRADELLRKIMADESGATREPPMPR